MLVSIALLLFITAGGFGLTYRLDREGPFMWRAAAGCVVGSAIFGTVSFVLAMAFGLTAVTTVAAAAVAALPAISLLRGPVRASFAHDRAKAKGKLDGANMAKLLRFAYYAGFAILFVFFFDRAMYETAEGIFTGGSNNLGDLPFHLGAIYSFTDGANFPPQNPNFAGAKFSYPFIADLITAGFMKLGAGVRDAMFVQDVAWAMSLLVVVERFLVKLTGDRLAGKIAPVLLFFSGGLGFIWFFGDYFGQGKGFFEFLNALPKDYTIGDEFRWGNSLTTLFLTQRSLLLGMPLTVLSLGFLWEAFVSETEEYRPAAFAYSVPLLFGIVAGTLPLVHLHSLAVLFVVTGALLTLRPDKWREFVAFGIGVCLIAVPELVWSVTGSASRATEFIAWHFGFDARGTNIFWFWLKNAGLFIPMLIIGIYILVSLKAKHSGKKGNAHDIEHTPHPRQMALFYIPFLLLFVIANVAKLAPWEWDNIKVLIYWFLGSLPFVAVAIAWMWERKGIARAAAVLCLLLLTVSGALDVWRTASRQISYKAFDADAVSVAAKVRAATAPDSIFLNAPTYNSAIVLTGRPSLIRYPGHLSSHGIDYRQREEDARAIYRGGPEAMRLIEKYGIEYVLISPEEGASVSPNEAFFSRFPIAAQTGQYRVYRVAPGVPE